MNGIFSVLQLQIYSTTRIHIGSYRSMYIWPRTYQCVTYRHKGSFVYGYHPPYGLATSYEPRQPVYPGDTPPPPHWQGCPTAPTGGFSTSVLSRRFLFIKVLVPTGASDTSAFAGKVSIRSRVHVLLCQGRVIAKPPRRAGHLGRVTYLRYWIFSLLLVLCYLIFII